MEVNGFYEMDCMDGIDAMDNNSIGLCAADPPYGIDFQSTRQRAGIYKPKIENDKEPYTDWIRPMFNKQKDGGRLVCFYRWDVQSEFLDAIQSAGYKIKSQLVWDKGTHGMGDLKGEFGPTHELMLYATKGRYIFQSKRPTTVYRCQKIQPNDQIHPNEKPVDLMRAIIRDLTIKGEQVADPFGGSFSTYIASQLEERPCLTYEKSKYYFDLGVKNIKSRIIKTELF